MINHQLYKIVTSCFIFLALLHTNPVSANLKANIPPAKDISFDMQYHRGGRNSRPENTLYAYLFAIEQGATIECDMQLTKSGEIVLSHDPFLLPEIVKDENGNYVNGKKLIDIRDLTLTEIRKYNVGGINPDTEYYKQHGQNQLSVPMAQIPTLDELFILVKACGRPIKINLETKIYHDIASEPRAIIRPDPKYFVKIFNEKVLEYGLESQVMLQSFDWATLVAMKEINPKITTLALFNQQPKWGRNEEYLRPYEKEPSPYLAGLHIDYFKGNAVKAAHSLGIDGISPYCKEVTIDMVEEAHQYGMKIIPWNANTLSEIEAMYAMGVDGIISDNGPLLRKFLLKHKEKLLPVKKFKNSPYHLKQQ